MAKTIKRSLGDIGEDIVAKYLENKGYSIIGRNYWRPWGEIDLIFEKGGKIHFIEVKSVSREASAGIRPEENMHTGKVKKFQRAVQTYLLEKKVPESREWQIDLACVTIDTATKKASVEIIENIVL